MFLVKLAERAEREFNKLPRTLQQKIFQRLKQLEINPFTLPIKKIKGTEFGYRLRVGRWRILFGINFPKKQIEVVDIFLKKGDQDYERRKFLLK